MTSAPTLSANGQEITLSVPGDEPVVLNPGPRGRPTIAKYRTTMRVPGKTRTVTRVGWRLLAGDGSCLAWLVNSDRPAYADPDVEAFAQAAGLAVVDLGEVPYADLHADRGLAIGPGTSRVTSLVAPPFQWMLTGVIAGSVALAIGPFIGPGRSQGTVIVGAVVALIGMFAGLLLAQVLGLAQHVWRERRYVRTHPSDALRSARRTPGLALVADRERLYVYDYARSWEGAKDAATLAPYDVPQGTRAHSRGLFVTWSGSPERVDIPADFDPNELTAFASRHRIALRPATLEQLPKKPEATEVARVWFVDRIARVAWIGPLLWLIALTAVVVAVLGLMKVLAVPIGACVSLCGLALLIASGYGMAALQFSDSLVHPDRVTG